MQITVRIIHMQNAQGIIFEYIQAYQILDNIGYSSNPAELQERIEEALNTCMELGYLHSFFQEHYGEVARMETALLTDRRTVEIYEKKLKEKAKEEGRLEAAQAIADADARAAKADARAVKAEEESRDLAKQLAVSQMKIYAEMKIPRQKAIKLSSIFNLPIDVIDQAAAEVYSADK